MTTSSASIGGQEGTEGQGVAAEAAALAPCGLSPEGGSQAKLPAANVEHTSLPWMQSKGSPEYICNNGFWIASMMGIRGHEGEANAAFIVRACNSHYALTEALKVADDAINEMFRYFDGGETRGSYDGKPERNQLRMAGYKVRAAIALSRGEA